MKKKLTLIKGFLPGVFRLLSNIAPLLLVFVFSKFIPTAELGLLNYFVSLITIIGIFTDFGLPEALQKYLAGGEGWKVINTTVRLEFLLVGITAVLVILLDLVTNGFLGKGYTLLLAGVIIASASNTIILTFNGLREGNKVSKYFGGSAVSFIVVTLGLFFLARMDAVPAFLWGRLISWLIFTIIALADLGKRKIISWRVESYKLPRRYLIFAVNNLVIMVANSLVGQWDSLLVTNVLGQTANGIYKSVMFVGTTPLALVTILNTTFLPEFSNLVAAGKERLLQEKVLRMGLGLGVAGIIITIVVQLFAVPLLTIIYNADIARAGQGLLLPALLSTFAFLVATPAMSLLLAREQEYFVRNVTILQALSLIVFSVILVPIYGMTVLPVLLLIINLGYSVLITLKVLRK